MSTQRLEVEITGDASGIARASQQASRSVAGVAATAERSARTYIDAQGRMRDASGRFVSSGVQGNQELGNSFGIPVRAINQLIGRWLALDTVISAAKQGLQIVSDFQRLDTALMAVSTSSEDFARSQSFLRSTADQYGLSLESLSKSYTGLKAASNGTALQGAATERIFLAVSKASAALQLSADQTEGALLALQQMMSKGKVQAEELRGQLGERLPGAFKLAAQAMGVSEAKLNKLLETGKVTANDLLPKLATQLEKTYGASAQKNVDTMAGGFQRAKNETALFVSEFAKTAGIDAFFAKLTNGVADYLKLVREAQSDGSLFGSVRRNTPAFQKELDDFKKLDTKAQQGQLAKLAKEIGELEKKWVALTNGVQTDAVEKQQLELDAKIRERRSAFTQLRTQNRRMIQQQEQDANALKRINQAGSGEEDDKSPSERIQEQLKKIDKQILDFKVQHPGVTIPFRLAFEKGRLMDLLGEREKATLGGKDIEAIKPHLAPFEKALKLTEGGIKSKVEQTSHNLKLAMDAANREAVQIMRERVQAIENMQAELTRAFARGVIDASTYERLKADAEKWSDGVLPDSVGYELEEKLQKILDLKKKIQKAMQEGFLPPNYNVAQATSPDRTTGELEKEEKKIAERQQKMEAFKDLIEKNKGEGLVTPKLTANMQAIQEMWAKGLIPDKLAEKLGERFAELTQVLNGGWQQLGQTALSGAITALGEASAGQKGAFQRFAQGTFNLIADYMAQVGKAALLAGLPMLANPLTAAIGGKQIATGGALIAGSMVVRGLASKIQVPALAEGGMAYGPTMALIGDNPRANVDPEVVAPFSKLEPYLAGKGKQQVQVVIPELRLRHSDIYIAWHIAHKNRNEFT